MDTGIITTAATEAIGALRVLTKIMAHLLHTINKGTVPPRVSNTALDQDGVVVLEGEGMAVEEDMDMAVMDMDGVIGDDNLPDALFAVSAYSTKPIII
jgi:hypothetical protein